MTSLQEPIGSPFGAASTAGDVLAGLDLSGRTAIVTGGYSGLGLVTTKALSNAGAEVIVPARDLKRAEAALAGGALRARFLRAWAASIARIATLPASMAEKPGAKAWRLGLSTMKPLSVSGRSPRDGRRAASRSSQSEPRKRDGWAGPRGGSYGSVGAGIVYAPCSLRTFPRLVLAVGRAPRSSYRRLAAVGAGCHLGGLAEADAECGGGLKPHLERDRDDR